MQGGIARRHDAGEQVGVPGEVLGRALPREVGAEVERALQERRGERVVAAQQRTARMRGRRVLGDVGDGERRVGGCLDDRERRSLAGSAKALGIAQVIAAHVDSEAREHLGAQQLDLVVAARRDDERLALSQHAEADARPGGHAAREDRRVSVLEGAQQRLGLGGHGRMATAVGRVPAGHALEGRRAIERGREPARGAVDESAYEQRVGLHAPKHSTRWACVRLRGDVRRGAGADPAIAIAWTRSSQRSSTCSRPTESRSRPSGTRPSGSMRARRSISVSMPPRLVAQRARRTLSSQLPAVGPSASSNARTPPAPPASGAVRARGRDGRGGRGSAPRAPRDAPRAAVRARCGRHLARKAHVQRPQTAQEQPRGVGSEHAADRAARQHQSLAQLRIARRDDAGEHVGVAGEVLGRALPREVGAEVERALEQRRRERAVAAQQRTARVRGLRGDLDVGEGQQRVGGRLDERERGAEIAGPPEILGVTGIDSAAPRRRSARGSPM